MTLAASALSRSEVKVSRFIGLAALTVAISCGGAESGGGETVTSGAGPGDPRGGGAERAAPKDAERTEGRGECPGARERITGWIIDEDLATRLGEAITAGAGPIPVEYEACTLEVVDGCRLPGSYRFALTDRTKHSEYIYGGGDLFRLLPFAAPGLEDEFLERDFWILDAVTVGSHASSTEQLSADALGAECERATHFVSRLETGAYRLKNQVGPARDRNFEPVRVGGVYERCVLTASDATSAACSRVVRVELDRIAAGPPLPTGDPHTALGSFPGPHRGVRLEASCLGQRLPVPARGEVTVLAFWSAACPPCDRICAEERAAGGKLGKRCRKEIAACEACSEEEVFEPSRRALGELERIGATGCGRQVTFIGAAVDLDPLWARGLLAELGVSFPQVIDDEQRKLARRYHVEDRFPAIFVLDGKGTVRFFSDGTPDDFTRIGTVLEALLAE
jgi:hypothetical protein